MIKQLNFVAALVIAFCTICTSSLEAQRNNWRGGDFFDNPASLLVSEQIQNEVGVTDEQMEMITELLEKSRDQAREMFRNRGEGMDWNEIQEKMKEMGKEAEAEVEEILEPFQMQRLKQISLQNTQRRGTTNALEKIADDLDIDEKQMEKLKTAAEEAQKVYEEAVAKAREEMEESILNELTSEQRTKYRELVGDKFEWEQRRRRGDNNDREDQRRRDR